MKDKLLIQGMHGLGDCIHQRAFLKKLSPKYEIWLETSWPSVYHDMPEINLVKKDSKLRTQRKNSSREADKFKIAPQIENVKAVWYRPDDVRRYGGVLAAMMVNMDLNPINMDFSLPVPKEWHFELPKIHKPILVYRPLIIRKEWGGCEARNPDIEHYYDLISEIRDEFFVISIADVVPNVEWIVSKDIRADLEFHEGQLTFEQIASIVQEAALTFNSPGFLSVLSKAVGTPNICIFGGYENSSSFSAGTSRYLGIDTIKPCSCFSHYHRCEKRIDIETAKQKIREFI